MTLNANDDFLFIERVKQINKKWQTEALTLIGVHKLSYCCFGCYQIEPY